MKTGCKRISCLLLFLALLAAPVRAATVWGYQEGLALTEENGLWGYSDVSRQVVIPIRYTSATSFRLGLARVEENGKLGIIRTDGTLLISPAYGTLDHLYSGLYIAQSGTRWGIISILPFPDGKGGVTQVLYDFVYDSITLSTLGGLETVILTKDGAQTLLPVYQITDLMLSKQIPSARFPLTEGDLPDFADVSPRQWYDVWVDIACNVGLMEGVGSSRFAPDQTLTVAEALQLAAEMESRQTGDNFHTQVHRDSPWYRPAVEYCQASGIISAGEFSRPERPVTRAEMAKIFAATSLAQSMPNRNDLARVRVSVPDVKSGDYAADAIFSLYAKGVLTGGDQNLTFRPNDTLTRAEAAAIVARMARAEQRLTLF